MARVVAVIENASAHPNQARSGRVAVAIHPEKIAAFARRHRVSLEEARKALEAAFVSTRMEHR